VSAASALSSARAGTLRLKQRLLIRTRAERLAARVVGSRFGARPLHDLSIDLRYGGWCGGKQPNPFAANGAVQIQSVHYDTLDRLFRRVEIADRDVLVDVGCGRGRVLNWWLRRGGPNRIVGLELVEDVARRTRKRLARFPNVEIVTGDAVEHIPPTGTLYFLYNPFGRDTVARFAERLRRVALHPSRLRILYFNPRHVDVFEDPARWTVTPVPTGDPESAVLVTPARVP
jgi:SAM-dependent methyltransferase